ncbi:hypothetical protein EJ04DRAFT_234291 [Polyplosphaeria fusca]|uniref:Uncharacterized protein n=1 Tax=Polyplosphaeria fusca TaxID=682080 RepID=A0A9P4V523_9PLEO|nr:hypothetical protein EJ04DRAFT_234291 [Polyplosphaeria fusca]
MTPWLRRQWHVLSLLRPVGRAPTRPFRPRAYASNPPVVHRLNSAIIIPSNVPGTQPDDIIAYINPVTTTLKDRLAVFFVTPAFATWLLDDFTFLRKALDKIFKTAASQSLWRHTRIEAVVAVVDKLPVPRPLEDAGNIAEESLKRAQNPPVLDTGHEGVAYAVLNKNDTVRDLDAYATEKGAITFLLSDRPAVDGSGISLKTLHLPLANTIFQTGTTTTIKHTVWVSQGGDGDLELTSSRDLEHFGLRLQKHGHTLPSATVLSVPLIPLTEPRVVEASMGNIVRRVFDSNGKSVTASEELEQRVPQYFTSRHEPSQHMTVWALVIPQSALPSISQNTERFLSAGSVGANANAEAPLLELWKSMWNSDPARWNELVPQALERGARLHRVLSGGGGWGKKAGLLSLDPSFNSKTEVSYPDLASPPGLSEKFDDFSSVLHNIIQPGDAVQFFIFPGDVQHGSTASETAPEQLQRLSNSALPWTWEIGTIPSTIDSIQNTARQFSKPPPKEIHVVRGSFGALSEGAMRFKHQFMPKDSYNSMVKGGCDIDVPFTRLAAVGLKALSEPERTTRVGGLAD